MILKTRPSRGLLSHEAEFIFRSIKESGGKAIKQGLETVRRMNLVVSEKSRPFSAGENYLFVVTYDALHLGNSLDFEEIYGLHALTTMYQEFGKPLPLPLANVFFITIEEFESLLAAIYEKSTTFLAVIKRVQENDSTSGSRKFSFMQHLAEIAPNVKPLPTLKASLEQIIARITSHLPAGIQSGSESVASPNQSPR